MRSWQSGNRIDIWQPVFSVGLSDLSTLRKDGRPTRIWMTDTCRSHHIIASLCDLEFCKRRLDGCLLDGQHIIASLCNVEFYKRRLDGAGEEASFLCGWSWIGRERTRASPLGNTACCSLRRCCPYSWNNNTGGHRLNSDISEECDHDNQGTESIYGTLATSCSCKSSRWACQISLPSERMAHLPGSEWETPDT